MPRDETATSPPAGDGARPDRARLREVVADCLEQLEVDGSRAIDDACARHPELASEIRRRLGRLRELGLAPDVKSPWNVPKRLGDFDLGEPIGFGGMGIVYHARQRSLSRDVALKVIRPDLQWIANTQTRFRREIEAVSRLQHPSIVQIHAVGEEQGIAYFAMEHVAGCTIAAILDRLQGRPPQTLTGEEFWSTVQEASATKVRGASTEVDARLRGRSWTETCVHVAQQIAIALDHAHRRGVLHRDVKPQNVMITPEGRVVVMDFGLAVTEGSQKLTRTGAEIGSLLYMAPEQLLGRHADVDVVTDVWGLGATLYEMLLLRPAFGPGPEEQVRRQIQEGDFPKPRSLVPALSWDVETVCLVALERDPRRRYASAAAFADDLDRILHHRSIEARRPGFALRARRWVERHPALAVAMALLLVLTGASIVFAIQQRDANLKTKAALEDVRLQSERAQRNVRRAQTAIDLMLRRFADTHLKNVPQFEQIRRSLLEDAVSLQRAMLSEEGSDPRVRREAADAYDRLSAIEQMLGDSAASLASIEKALEIREELLAGAASTPEEFRRHDEIALGHHDLGNTYRELGDWERSERHFRKAMALSEASLRDHPEADGFAVTLARSLADLAITLTGTARPEEAIASCRRAFELVEPLARKQPTNAVRLDQVAAALQTQGPPLVQLRRVDEAVDCLTRALEWRQKLVALDPRDLQPRRQLGLLHYQISVALREQGEVEEASSAIDDSIDVQRALLADYPSAEGVRWDLAQSLHERGLVLRERLEPDEAIASLREAIALYEPLLAGAPSIPGYAHELGWTLADLAALLLEQEDAAEAERLVRRAIDLQSGCLGTAPAVVVYQECLLDHGRVLRDVLLARKEAGALVELAALAERIAKTPFAEPLRRSAALFRATTLLRCRDLAAEAGGETAGADGFAAGVESALKEAAAAPAPAAAPSVGAGGEERDLADLRARPELAPLLAGWAPPR